MRVVRIQVAASHRDLVGIVQAGEAAGGGAIQKIQARKEITQDNEAKDGEYGGEDRLQVLRQSQEWLAACFFS